MKIALSLMLALVTTTALAEPLPVPKPPGPGGSCPHGYIASGSFCTLSSGALETIAKPPAHARGACSRAATIAVREVLDEPQPRPPGAHAARTAV
jgi:hypothetical protein